MPRDSLPPRPERDARAPADNRARPPSRQIAGPTGSRFRDEIRDRNARSPHHGETEQARRSVRVGGKAGRGMISLPHLVSECRPTHEFAGTKTARESWGALWPDAAPPGQQPHQRGRRSAVPDDDAAGGSTPAGRAAHGRKMQVEEPFRYLAVAKRLWQERPSLDPEPQFRQVARCQTVGRPLFGRCESSEWRKVRAPRENDAG